MDNSEKKHHRKKLGKNLQDERKRNHLTQEQLAECLNLSVRQLRRYEAGQCMYSFDILQKLIEMKFDLYRLMYGVPSYLYHFFRGIRSIPNDELKRYCQIITSYDDNSLTKDVVIDEFMMPIIKYSIDHNDIKPIRDFNDEGLELMNEIAGKDISWLPF